MFVITGATGNTGSVAASALLDAGKPVRVLVRDPVKAAALAARGAEVVTGNLGDPAAAERAFAGASAVYLLSPPDLRSNNFVAERKPWLTALAQAARTAQVKHVVFLSSIGAQHETGTGPIRTLYAGEQALRATGLPVTFVRAAYFIDNWAGVLPTAKSDGVLPSFLPADLAIPMVAARDIGRTVAQALLDGPRGTRIIELGGPREASATDVAAAVAKLFGRKVAVAEGPLDAVVPTFTSYGMSSDVAGLFREMYEGMRTGKVAWQGKGAELVRGPTGIEEALRPLAG